MIVAGREAEMTPHLGCFALTLNLASQKAFQVNTAAKLLGRVRWVVGFLHRNRRGAEILREKRHQLALPSHKLIIDVFTKWNSSHDMRERFLEEQPEVFATLVSRELRKGEGAESLELSWPLLKGSGIDQLNLSAALGPATTTTITPASISFSVSSFSASPEAVFI
ncbi:Zinc finger BED domain-containing protein 4 [Merluccius polli]|uniref:Zinc finger BED domain-containing protein 4 n=1 Tax=Merluccius polli TaxID=89951 RepID=A0AA47N2S2_MERPO|nr:Zinc finger BED domain-containing protein 4 [Merluccius polli]